MDNDNGRKKIVEKALQMFNERGCRGVTMDDIASAMHISKRTLYETFANKEELLSECLQKVHTDIGKMHKKIYQRVDDPLLMALCMVRVNILSNSKYHRLMEDVKQQYNEVYCRHCEIHFDGMRKLMQRGIRYVADRHYLRPEVDVEDTIDIMSRFMQQHHTNEETDTQEYARRVGEVLFTYLRGLMSVDTIMRYEQEENRYREMLDELRKDETLFL